MNHLTTNMERAWHVLPIGAVNLVTGANNTLGNVLDDDMWGKDDQTLVLVKKDNKYFGIFGSSGSYGKPGEIRILQHDQSMRNMGRVEVVGEFRLRPGKHVEGIKPVISKIGKKILSCLVFK